MDEFTRDFLDKNGLDEYIQVFKAHKVTQAVLPLLSKDVIASLITPFGDQAVFKQARAKLFPNDKKHPNSKSQSGKTEEIHKTIDDVIPETCPVKFMEGDFSGQSGGSDDEQSGESDDEQSEKSGDESDDISNIEENVESPSEVASKSEKLGKKLDQEYDERVEEARRNKGSKRKVDDAKVSDNENENQNKKRKRENVPAPGKGDSSSSKKVLCSSKNERFETKEDYKKFLMSVKDGKDVLSYYQTKGTLNETSRNGLVRLVISKLMAIKDNKLDNKDFELAAKIICKVFPGESKSTYYVPPVNKGKGKSIPSSGKLPRRYRNVKNGKKGKAIKQGISESKEEKVKTNVTDKFVLLSDDDYKKKKSFLDFFSEPWTEVCQTWVETSPNRLRLLIKDEGNKVGEILLEWPLFKHPSAPTLINIDFNQLHHLKQSEFLVRWPNSKVHVAEYMSRNFVNSTAASLVKEAISNGHNDASLLHLLPALLHSTVIRKKGKKTWKPTILESQEAFILCKSTKSEITESLAKRKEKLFNLGYTMQPCIAIQGQSVDDPNAAYFLIIDQYFYKVENILLAVDVCFKCFHVLNIEYPVEVFDVWMFIQRYFFNIYTKHDNLSTQVTTLLNAL